MAPTPNRQQYSKQFKIDAVELSLRGDKSIKEIADDLGINPNALYRWKSQNRASKESAFVGTGNLKDAQSEEIRQLQLKLRLVTVEREFLKKALAVFSEKMP